MTSVDVLIVIDVQAVRSSGKVHPNVYFIDSNMHVVSALDGLWTTCTGGQVVNWRVASSFAGIL